MQNMGSLGDLGAQPQEFSIILRWNVLAMLASQAVNTMKLKTHTEL